MQSKDEMANRLNNLIEAYNTNETLSPEEIISDLLKNDPSSSELNLKDILELKRQFMDYVCYPER